MTPPRLLPHVPLPPYGYVPGLNPRPEGEAEIPPEDRFAWGVDLFHNGYYWEAHEAWEGCWHAAGRRGPVADRLKGLIRLAAAGVKVRQRQPDGVASHAAGAAALFRRAGDEAMARVAEGVRYVEGPETEPPVRVVFDIVLSGG